MKYKKMTVKITYGDKSSSLSVAVPKGMQKSSVQKIYGMLIKEAIANIGRDGAFGDGYWEVI